MSGPVVADNGNPPEAPVEGNLYVSDVDMGYGDIGHYIEWQHLRDGWILAKDTDSFVSLDNYQ